MKSPVRLIVGAVSAAIVLLLLVLGIGWALLPKAAKTSNTEASDGSITTTSELETRLEDAKKLAATYKEKLRLTEQKLKATEAELRTALSMAQSATERATPTPSLEEKPPATLSGHSSTTDAASSTPQAILLPVANNNAHLALSPASGNEEDASSVSVQTEMRVPLPASCRNADTLQVVVPKLPSTDDAVSTTFEGRKASLTFATHDRFGQLRTVSVADAELTNGFLHWKWCAPEETPPRVAAIVRLCTLRLSGQEGQAMIQMTPPQQRSLSVGQEKLLNSTYVEGALEIVVPDPGGWQLQKRSGALVLQSEALEAKISLSLLKTKEGETRFSSTWGSGCYPKDVSTRKEALAARVKTAAADVEKVETEFDKARIAQNQEKLRTGSFQPGNTTSVPSRVVLPVISSGSRSSSSYSDPYEESRYAAERARERRQNADIQAAEAKLATCTRQLQEKKQSLESLTQDLRKCEQTLEMVRKAETFSVLVKVKDSEAIVDIIKLAKGGEK